MNSQFADPSTTQANPLVQGDREHDTAVFDIEIEEVEMTPSLLKQGCIC
ncbi:hypothetical protein ABZ508_21565 [Streptomyces lavendulocolor]|uniref:Uncharacterized protein n=1 Tax=Streptomyces lavendulocolor TaxID=67316 RepID=A0ABV2WAI9_9ACTN